MTEKLKDLIQFFVDKIIELRNNKVENLLSEASCKSCIHLRTELSERNTQIRNLQNHIFELTSVKTEVEQEKVNLAQLQEENLKKTLDEATNLVNQRQHRARYMHNAFHSKKEVNEFPEAE